MVVQREGENGHAAAAKGKPRIVCDACGRIQDKAGCAGLNDSGMIDPMKRTLTCLAVLACTACATPGSDGGKTPIGQLFAVTGGPVQPQPLTPRNQITYHVLAAEVAGGRGENRVAAEQYLAAAKLSENVDVARNAVRYALSAGDSELAVAASTRWAELAPDDDNAQEAALRVALQAEDPERSVMAARELVQRDKRGAGKGVREVARIIVRQKPPQALAMQVIQAVTYDVDDAAQAAYSRGLVQMEYGDFAAASMSAESALEARPGWSDAVLLKASLLIRQGRLLQGIAAAEPMLSSGDRARERFALARLLIDEKAYALAKPQLERALEEDPGLGEARYALALMALDDKDTDNARSLLLPLLDERTERDGAAYYLGRLAQQDGDTEQAMRYYRMVSGGQHAVDALARRAFLMAEQGELEQAQLFLRGIAAANPQLTRRLLMVEGDLLIEQGKPEDAVARYTEALEVFEDDSDLLYSRSLAHERAGDVDAAKADLRRMLELDGDDARALNALGYILTNHSTRYREALGYIKRALELQPNDPAIIDSMGWVQYRLGNYERARNYLQKAFDSQPDPEVAAHLGEVYWKLGQQERAREIWDAALADAPEHPALRETVQRLTQ